MNTCKYMGFAAVAAMALMVGNVSATPTPCPNAPATGNTTQGGPTCIASQGSDGPGTGLQDMLNGITKSGSPIIDVYNDQWTPDAYWSIGATGSSENTLMFEIAGNSPTNTFGIYDPANHNNFLSLFDGPATTGYTTTLRNMGGGVFKATYFDAAGNVLSQNTANFGSGNLFGYYLGTTADGNFYSDAGLNAPGGSTYPNGMRHMAAYQGSGTTSLCITSPTNCGLFLPNEFILAWEDSVWANSDLDYNDFVVMVESVHPVPEPAALGLFGFGVLLVGAAAGLRRRRSARLTV